MHVQAARIAQHHLREDLDARVDLGVDEQSHPVGVEVRVPPGEPVVRVGVPALGLKDVEHAVHLHLGGAGASSSRDRERESGRGKPADHAESMA